jgi:hypothetical protein
VRTFEIAGAVSVTEFVTFNESKQAAENSQSKEEKDTICQVSNENGVGGGDVECINITCNQIVPGNGGGSGSGI